VGVARARPARMVAADRHTTWVAMADEAVAWSRGQGDLMKREGQEREGDVCCPRSYVDCVKWGRNILDDTI
jgi:hypothetical protein